jgi:aldehyde dehydrogenase (NAD+)
MQARNELLIDGEWRQSGSLTRIPVVSPATEQQIGEVSDANEADVDAAVNAARRAFDDGSWCGLPLVERAEILTRALGILKSRSDEIADLVTAEMGVPTSISRRKTPAGIWVGEYFLDLARATARSEVRATRFGPTAVVREPVGVVAAITPWNSPFNMAIAKIIPALVTGCTLVFKPAPETPLDVFEIADALQEAGLPRGVFNLITGGRESGRALTSHSGIDKISFTGSTAAGREIARTAGPNFKRLQLELGGKSAAIIADDADQDTVRRGIIDGTFVNTGQTCNAFTRILVPANRHDKWANIISEAAASYVIGDPMDPATTMGPLASRTQYDRVLDYVEIGKQEGARVLAGGGRVDGLDSGYYVEPTVLVGTDNTMRVSREEIFGPVAVVIPYTTLDEAVAIANDSDYGLHGGVFTENPTTAERVARSVRTGTFSINTFTHNVQAPFGGIKDSGVGREFGPEGIQAFYELKSVNLTEQTAALFDDSEQS